MLDELGRNLRYGVRMLARNPVFTLTAIVTLGLCIGANTAIFSVVDAVLLRALPYPQPDRLAHVVIWERGRSGEQANTSIDGRMWEALRDGATNIDAAVYSDFSQGVNLANGSRAQYVHQHRVSSGYFRVLGVSPAMGREFNGDEDRAGGSAATILAYPLWKRTFNADPSVIGRAVMLRGEPHTIVGVMPQGFRSSNATPDLWTPIRPSVTSEGGGTNYGVIARLKPGITWPQAEAQVESACDAVVQAWKSPDVSAQMRLIPLQRGWTEDMRTPLLILWAAVAVVLLIGCVNVAGLLMARAAGRSRETATRMAIGGGRAAVIRQLLTESLLLAFCGAAAGTAVGYFGLYGLRLFGQSSYDVLQAVTFDVRVFTATAVMALATTILFGLLPALEATRTDICSALTGGGARSVAGSARRWPRRLLLVVQVAMAIVLLVSAGLLVRTLIYFNNLDPGFDGTNVITALLSLDDARYRKPESMNVLLKRCLDRIREMPGVESAAVGLGVPYERWLNMGVRRLDGPNADPPGQGHLTNFTYITEDYFRTLRIPVKRGRAFNAADTAGSRPVAIVNEAFVRKYLKSQEPVGSHIGSGRTSYEIVGVVGDIEQKNSLDDSGSPLLPLQAVFIPATQTREDFLRLVHTWFAPEFVVRSSGPAGSLIAAMQNTIESIDPTLPFASFRTMDDIRAGTLGMHRFVAVLLGTMALLALVLAVVGTYGLMANAVMERSRELGIRMALGATIAQAIWTVVQPGALLTLAGILIGCAFARAAVRVLQSLVWGISTTDPATFLVVALGLLLVSVAASVIPALRIVHVNPARTLREE